MSAPSGLPGPDPADLLPLSPAQLEGGVSLSHPPRAGLYMCAVAVALEVSVGKTNVVTALNGSDVLLPCVFTTCIGFWDLVFTWSYNDSTTVRGLQSTAVPGFYQGWAWPAAPAPSVGVSLAVLGGWGMWSGQQLSS